MLSAHGVTDRGRVRPINEDRFHVDLSLGLVLVADGMGGHNAGETASTIAAETIHGFLARTREDEEFTWPFGVDPRLSLDANRLSTAMRLANRRVFRTSESRNEYTGMGTTVVAALIQDAAMTFASVGDSRIYSLRGGVLTQLTRDDSWLDRLAAEPGVDKAALKTHPMRHVLTNVVGAREQMDVEVSQRELEDREVLLLCSDGLHGALDAAAIADILGSGQDVRSAAESLVHAALERDPRDNITALLVQYCGGADETRLRMPAGDDQSG